MPKDEKTVVKSIRMSIELAQRIQKLADKQNRNFSNMCETLLLTASLYGQIDNKPIK